MAQRGVFQAAVFRSVQEAREAMKLGPVRFKCAVCGRTHWSHERGWERCVRRLWNRRLYVGPEIPAEVAASRARLRAVAPWFLVEDFWEDREFWMSPEDIGCSVLALRDYAEVSRVFGRELAAVLNARLAEAQKRLPQLVAQWQDVARWFRRNFSYDRVEIRNIIRIYGVIDDGRAEIGTVHVEWRGEPLPPRVHDRGFAAGEFWAYSLLRAAGIAVKNVSHCSLLDFGFRGPQEIAAEVALEDGSRYLVSVGLDEAGVISLGAAPPETA